MGLSVSKPQKKKANLGDFPVSHQATEARVMFTWVSHDKTREAKSQEQICANFIVAGVCMCIMCINGPLGGKCKRCSKVDRMMVTWLQFPGYPACMIQKENTW